MGAVLSFFRPARVAQGDWSQQELAEFYRVEAALTQSGLHVTSDRGLSDEDDPWFVFCRFDGDVILHFARIDGQYVVASDAFERPLHGPDFRALLNMVAAEHPTLVPLPRPDSQGRRGNLILHPAALLAAIVASVAFQLAGGDAVAGELASDAPPAGLQSDGADAAHGHAGLIQHAGPDGRHHDPLPRKSDADEERNAQQHVLILSVMALISTTLPTDDEAGSTASALGDSTPVRHREHATLVPTVEGKPSAAIEDARVRAQTHDASAADAPNAQSASGYMAFVHSGQIQLGTVQAPTGVEAFDFAGATRHHAPGAHAPDALVPVAALSGPNGAPRLLSVAAAAERTAPGSELPPSAETHETSTTTPAAHGAAPATTGSASPSAKLSADGGSEADAGLRHASVGSGSLSGSASSGGAQSTVEKAAAVGATWTTSASAQATGVSAVQSTGASGNIRSALNTILDQLTETGDASALGSTSAFDALAKLKMSDSSLLSTVKGIGLKVTSDTLFGLGDLLPNGTATKLSPGVHLADGGVTKVGVPAGADDLLGALPTLDVVNVGSVVGSHANAPALPGSSGGSSIAPGSSASASEPVKNALAQAGGATLDTAALKLPAAAAAVKSLDEHGRQLIARFLDATPQVQTFVTEHSFVLIDMDAANYTNKDFAVRTWSVGHDMEISIVGISIDSPHGV